jgi:hypothetical protein
MEEGEQKNNFFPYIVNPDIDILLPKEKRTSFQTSFGYLRKKLQIKLTRKSNIDSILKKCKGKFFKAINDCLKKCTKKNNTIKIPHNFITNISIGNNKNIFTKSFIELYKEFNLPPINIDEFINEGKCIKGKENYLRYILVSNISDLYRLYIQSRRYKREIEIIKNYSGVKMMLLYKFVSENFINYYLYNKPHFCKKNPKKIKNNDNSNIVNKI